MIVHICSNKDCFAVWDKDPQGHCPACKKANGGGWSALTRNVRSLDGDPPTVTPPVEDSEVQEALASIRESVISTGDTKAKLVNVIERLARLRWRP